LAISLLPQAGQQQDINLYSGMIPISFALLTSIASCPAYDDQGEHRQIIAPMPQYLFYEVPHSKSQRP
jgi:hypothetical protein